MTLKLLVPPLQPSLPLDGAWRIKPTHEGQGYEEGFADSTLDDSAWEAVRLPHLRHATAELDTLWYRHRFDLAPSAFNQHSLAQRAERILLRFGGAFYRTRAWLNGAELGVHEGYFQPFGFDVTDLLKPAGNLLAVRCRFPVEAGSFKRKTAVAGIFTDWDCKPYPSALYPALPAPNEWTVPVGLWQPVRLQVYGGVVVESLNIFPLVVNPDWASAQAEAATLHITLGVKNPHPVSVAQQVRVEIGPAGDPAGTAAEGRWPVEVAAGECREFQFQLTLPRPRLWFPWSHGTPARYEAWLTVEEGAAESPPPDRTSGLARRPARQYRQAFGVRDIAAVIEPGRWEWTLNGRRIFPRGSNYISDFYLDRVTPAGLRRDIKLLKTANLDLVRVHAHIAPPEFYRLCDEMGVMVMCDFPLIWTYAYNLPPDEDAAFQRSVRSQTADMVRLLGSHPSVVLWSIHNEPPWTPDGSFLGTDVHASATNRQVDEEAAACIRALDPARPAIPASGVFDQHLYHGWYMGSWIDNHDLRPTFPTEFGVQALPNLDSPFWATVNSRWPVEAGDASWAHSGYQSLFWNSPGVGAPSQFTSLADYVAASQAYQAFFIRYTIDQWRRQKFEPVGGYIHFLFTDGWPAITWSVLDYYRLPKAGFHALAEASRPVHVCLDFWEGFAGEHGFDLVFPLGGTLRLKLWLVNDDYRRGGPAELRWWIEKKSGAEWVTRLGRKVRALFAERVPVQLPGAGERARLVQSLAVPLRQAGEYSLRVQLKQGRRILDESFLELRVGKPDRQTPKAPRRVPDFLVHQVYQRGDLRHTSDGFMFMLHNPTVQATLQRLREIRADNDLIDLAQVEVVQGGVSRRASTITPQAPLEIPSGERFAIVVRNYNLAPGTHELEITAEFLAVGELMARLKDMLM